MDVFHGNWRAPKASRPIITVEATEDAMKQLLAAFGIPSLDFAIGEPGQEEVMMQVSTTGSFPFSSSRRGRDTSFRACCRSCRP